MPTPIPTVDDLEAITKQTYDATSSSPPLAKVEALLMVGNAVVDGFARSLGLANITQGAAPQSYIILSHLAVLYAASQVTSAPGIDSRAEHIQSDYDRLRDQIIHRHIDLADATINESSWQAWACVKFLGSRDAWDSLPSRMRREAVLRLGAEMQTQNDMRSSGVESLLRGYKIRHLALINPDPDPEPEPETPIEPPGPPGPGDETLVRFAVATVDDPLDASIVWAEHTVTIVENPGGVQAIGFFVRTAHVTVPAAGYFFFEFDEALGFEDLIALALVNKGTSSGGVNQLGAFGRIDTVPNRIVYRSNRDDLTTSGITANYDWLFSY